MSFLSLLFFQCFQSGDDDIAASDASAHESAAAAAAVAAADTSAHQQLATLLSSKRISTRALAHALEGIFSRVQLALACNQLSAAAQFLDGVRVVIFFSLLFYFLLHFSQRGYVLLFLFLFFLSFLL